LKEQKVIFEIFFIYTCIIAILITGNYYIDLFTSKDQYTKDELVNITPYIKGILDIVINNYALVIFISVFVFSSLLGLIIPLSSHHWIPNSAFLFVLVFLVHPIVKDYFQKSQVTTSDDIKDTIINIFVKYDKVMTCGLGTGFGTGITYNWSANNLIHFFWFFINIIIIMFLMKVTFKKFLMQE
jgi:hypothetical protein